MRRVPRGVRTICLATLGGLALTATGVQAQGCEPIRFTTPIDLGGEGQAYQRGGRWRLTVAYRRLLSRDWYIGSTSSPDQAPGGSVPVFRINSLLADLAYSINDRIRVRVSVPYSAGSLTRVWPDRQSHRQTAAGVGDISLAGDLWLGDPKGHENGNIGLGLGVKMPTGRHDIGSQFYTATGPVGFPADQTIQPGDGGWAVTLQTQAFRRLAETWFLYGSGSYMVSPRAETDVKQSPAATAANWSVPDVYSARLGAAFSAFPDLGVSVSLGGRLDGIPLRDLVGGGDETTIKRTSRIIYADPGLSLTRGRSTFTLSVPVRLYVNRFKSLLEERSGGLGGGGFAKYLVFASASYRF